MEKLSLQDALQNAERLLEKTDTQGPLSIQNPVRTGDWRRRIFEEIISDTPDAVADIFTIREIVEGIFAQQSEKSMARFTEFLQNGFSVVSLSQRFPLRMGLRVFSGVPVADAERLS